MYVHACVGWDHLPDQCNNLNNGKNDGQDHGTQLDKSNMSVSTARPQSLQKKLTPKAAYNVKIMDPTYETVNGNLSIEIMCLI